MKCINYGKLLPGMIIGTTDTFDPLSAIIRISETSNAANVLNPCIASHVLAVCQEHDLLYGMGMTWPKIHQDDLNTFDNGDYVVFKSHIVFVADPFTSFDYEKRDAANKFLLHSHTLAIKYDIVELLRWWNFPVNDDPKKLVCGDLTYAMMWSMKLDYPKEWDSNITRHDPWDQQRYFTESKKTINWRR
jgi:hypothetical protein